MRKYHVFSLLFVLLAGLFTSCSKMDSTFADYVVPGGIIYVGRADSIAVHPGRDRIKITWLRGTDPKVSKAVVYWNNKNDSLVVPVTQKNPTDTVTAYISPMAEGTYSFNIYTYDEKKHSSVRVDLQGSTYNILYESVILPRVIGYARPMGDDLRMLWLKGDPENIATEINYIDLAGVSKQVILPGNNDSLFLQGVREGSSLTYRSLYKPTPLSMDTFYTAYVVRPLNIAFGKTALTSSANGANVGVQAVDNLTTTFWQPTQADRIDADKKVWITVNLNAPKEFNQVKHFISAGATSLDGYKILGSDDNNVWQTLYTKTGAPTAAEDISFPTATKRYVRLELSVRADANIQVAEIEIYKK